MILIPTFEELTLIEPRLYQLFRIAQDVDKMIARFDVDFCASAVWYGYGKYENLGLKPRLVTLVGHDANDDRLRSRQAYDVGYHTIYDALPDCRHLRLLC